MLEYSHRNDLVLLLSQAAPWTPLAVSASASRMSLLWSTSTLSLRSNLWTLRLSTQTHSLWVGMGSVSHFLSWEVLFDKNLCYWIFCLAFRVPVAALVNALPSEVWEDFPSPASEGVSQCVEIFIPSWVPGCSPWEMHPYYKVPCLPFYLLPYLILRRLPLLEVWGPLLVFRRCSGGVVPHADEFFDGFSGWDMISPSYSSAILKVSLQIFLI